MFPTLFQNMHKFSDCSLVSKGGKLKLTHKIVLASRSEFLRKLLADLPEASEAVIMLPDFSLFDIEVLIEKMIDDESDIQSNLWEMLVTKQYLNMNDANVIQHALTGTIVSMDDAPVNIGITSENQKDTFDKQMTSDISEKKHSKYSD